MPFTTQLVQVLRRDLRNVRWLLAGYALMLARAAWEGRRLLTPTPFVSDDPWAFQASSSVLGVTATHLITFGLAAVLALGFAPRGGAARPESQAWRTLPITPRAVVVARVAWVALGVALTALTTWYTLLPLPLPSALHLEITTSVAASTLTVLVAGALLAVVAGSLRRLMFGALALTVALLIGITALAASDFGVHATPIISMGTLGFTTPSVFVLSAIALLLLGLLLQSRRVRWPLRAAGAVVALYLLLANGARVPFRAPPVPPVAPTDIARAVSLEATFARPVASGTSTLNVLASASGGGTMGPRFDGASELRPLVDGADAVEIAPPVAAARNTIQLWPRFETPETRDRIVWRPRSAMVRSDAREWPWTTYGEDVVLTTGDPLPEQDYRPLNRAAISIPTIVAFAADDSSTVDAADAHVSLTVDVERQQPTLLALVPLDGSAASGPWAPFVTLRLIDSAPRPPTVGVRLTQLFASRLDGRTRGGPGDDVSFALVHPPRAELLHLSHTSRIGG
ncbi:MAG TPA: hypothetical protein PKE51_14240, partial [Gemmatimonadaceae bacterium]|nr:hypothetical protein [Gemmatimonadaceae bacterium]